MQDFPHRYHVSATASEDSDVALSSPSVEDIPSASPPEFGGPGNRWSPETLLTASVADCFVLTFKAIARASKFTWKELSCDAEGLLDRVDGQLQFTGFSINARLVIDAGVDAAKGEKLLHKAEQACLITNSLACGSELTTEVTQI